MRRAVPVLTATGGVLALLANFHTSPAPTGAVGPTAEPDAPTSSASTSSSAPRTTSLVPSTTAPRSTTTTTTTTAPTNGDTVDGPVARNEWGPVQVRVTFSGSQIVDVQALVLPHDNSHSAALSRGAGPKLRLEALQAQSAHIDVVSGATLTSESYIESLQGALDRSGR